jgi:hypothetical protein
MIGEFHMPPHHQSNLALNEEDKKMEDLAISKGYAKIEIYRIGLKYCLEHDKVWIKQSSE